MNRAPLLPAGLLAALGVALAIGSSGCATLFGLWYTVDRDDLDDIPNEEKLLLFDAENGVYIAKDEMETATRRLADAESALDRAEDYEDFIDDRKGSGASIDTPEVLSLLKQWNDARVRVREIEVERAEQQIVTAEARLWASRARYERAKALLVKDFNPEEGTSIDLPDFDEQVKDFETAEQEEVAKLEAFDEQLSQERERYHEISAQLQAVSGGAYGGPWADLLGN